MKCQQCNIETYMPFRCNYCGQFFCGEHRLPEHHNCPEYQRVKTSKEQSLAETEAWYKGGFTMHPPRKQRIVRFSRTEVKHLLIGVLLTLAIGFSIPLYYMSYLYNTLEVPITLALVFSFSFIIHELAHKIAAQHYGLWAEFRIILWGAIITLLTTISPFKIISPGAVMIGGMADKKTIGKVSIVGPLTNIPLALLFLLLTQVSQSFVAFGFTFAFALIAYINSSIAVFNLIPFGILDGFKVFSWNKVIWAVAFSISLALTVYSYYLFQYYRILIIA